MESNLGMRSANSRFFPLKEFGFLPTAFKFEVKQHDFLKVWLYDGACLKFRSTNFFSKILDVKIFSDRLSDRLLDFTFCYSGIRHQQEVKSSWGTKTITVDEVLLNNPVGIYLLKVSNRNTRAKCEICSKLIIKTPERRLALFWCLYC